MIYQATIQYNETFLTWAVRLKSAPDIPLVGVTREHALEVAQKAIGPKNAIQLINERH